eukprot:CAMPEP_0172500762 /NCGR_PEP_ID=MMETSP1066-20121228/142695_1 /TAXON_ID=671091 /ORGANISM="Coscinodiscus wailesii, Strain CCMP2513" /LENGTH=280 /DNA_ID=CAMNT_0013275181 /DNA_START=246 /DNA_END=1088 /DNA_ORIENTATION=+
MPACFSSHLHHYHRYNHSLINRHSIRQLEYIAATLSTPSSRSFRTIQHLSAPKKDNSLTAAKRGGVKPVAKYTVKTLNPFSLIISDGSVVTFSYPPNPSKSTIVNAANEQCLGGGGVDGAISAAGGANLFRDREKLPLVSGGNGSGDKVRCPVGGAVVTGPGEYGTLRVPYVIHAVGPNYFLYRGKETEGDSLLASAYRESLKRAHELGLEAVAFSLLSSGIFRGEVKTKEDVLRVGVRAIRDFEGFSELKEVHLCAFSRDEIDALMKIVKEEELEKTTE